MSQGIWSSQVEKLVMDSPDELHVLPFLLAIGFRFPIGRKWDLTTAWLCSSRWKTFNQLFSEVIYFSQLIILAEFPVKSDEFYCCYHISCIVQHLSSKTFFLQLLINVKHFINIEKGMKWNVPRKCFLALPLVGKNRLGGRCFLQYK